METPPSGRRKYAVIDDHRVLPARMKMLLDELVEFYKNGTFESVVLPIIHKREPLPLRDIDWLVTNYSHAFPVVYEDPVNPNGSPFNVSASYKRTEEVWKKHLFDPFQRKERILFTAGGQQYETTIAQLNFFRWAITYKVIDWAAEHKDEIREHHERTTRERSELIKNNPNREKKRMRLTKIDEGRCLFFVQSPIKQ